MSPPQFDDQLVYLLSNVRHIQQHVPSAVEPEGHQKKHLNLLDGIALLLVTGDKGDVAAVSFVHTGTSIEFFYAKNRPCTPQETAYIQKLLEMTRSFKTSESGVWVSRVLELVIQTCVKKVKGRMRKITNELKKIGFSSSLRLENLNNLPIWRETDRKGEIVEAYRRTFPSQKPEEGVSDRDILLRYFRGLFTVSGPEGQIEGAKAAVFLSRYIGIALRTDPIIGNATIVRRIQKLGDYAGAVQTLVKMLLDPAIYGFRHAIKFTEVKPAGQSIQLMPKNFLKVLNDYAIRRGKSRVQWKDLCHSFPSLNNRVEPGDGDMKVTTSIHCECTIATYLLNRAAGRPTAFEIGVSKHCCWLCEKYLSVLVEPDDSSILAPSSSFIVSGYQGKIHSGWHPPHWPPRAFNRMIGLVEGEIEEILGSITRTNRSDSFPRSPISEDSDIEVGDIKNSWF
ncbi:MAG: hypothetical protein M1839_004665 [Geoglossum umbratile]|nr:MAG: hypothetical protein M1839_004665 [Geoglossum umbratile]